MIAKPVALVLGSEIVGGAWVTTMLSYEASCNTTVAGCLSVVKGIAFMSLVALGERTVNVSYRGPGERVGVIR